MSSSDDETVQEIRATLPNGKEYLIQNGVPFKVIDQKKGEYFSGNSPKVKFITSSMKQWFNPEDIDEDSMNDRLQDIAKQLYQISGKTSDDTQNGPGENLFEKRVKKDCGPCKGTGVWKSKECTFCHGKGTN